MPVGKDNNKSKDDFWSVTPTNSEKEDSSNTKNVQHNANRGITRSSTLLSMTKPDEHKGAIPVVHIEAIMLLYDRYNNTFSWFIYKQIACKWSCNIIVKVFFFKEKRSPDVFLLKQNISSFKTPYSRVNDFLCNSMHYLKG